MGTAAVAEPRVLFRTTRARGVIPCLADSFLECRNGNARDYKRHVIVLVPQSYTLTAEQVLISMTQGEGLLGVEVRSPKTFAQAVAERAGRSSLEPLSAFGRVMMMGRVLKKMQKEDKLAFYQHAVRQPSFAGRLADQMDELREGSMTPEKFLALAGEQQRQAISFKYQDIAHAWEEYLEHLKGEFIDEAQQWEDMLSRLPESGLLQDTAFMVFGFGSFNREISDLIASAALLADRVIVGVMDDPEAPDSRIFETTHQSMLMLQEYLRNRAIPFVTRAYADYPPAEPALSFLERHLFSTGPAKLPDSFGAVEVYYAKSSYIECLHAAETLKKWHREGMEWSQMGVAWYAADVLPSLLPLVLQSAEIPFTVPGGKSMLMNGFADFFVSMLRAACLGFRREDVLKMLKTGYTSLTDEEAMDLENYAIEHGLDRGKWQKQLYLPEEEKAREKALQMEELRARIIVPLIRLQQALKKPSCTGAAAAREMYQTMMDLGGYARLLERQTQLLERGVLLELDRDRQVFDSVLELLDQIAMITREEHLTLEELPVLVENAFASNEIKSLPQATDAVQLNGIGQFLTDELEGLIIMGMQDRDSIPESGLINEVEREELRANFRVRIGLTRQERTMSDLMDLYSTMALAERRLMLSCSAAKPDGKVMYPSQLFRSLSHMVMAVTPENVRGGLLDDGMTPFTPQFTLERLAVDLRDLRDQGLPLTRLREEKENWYEALLALLGDRLWSDNARQILEGLSVSMDTEPLPESVAEKLYPEKNISISRLETFASCPYRHFIRHGLRPVNRSEFQYDQTMKGTFSHAVMEAFLKRLEEYDEMPSREEQGKILEEILAQLSVDWQDTPLGADAAGKGRAREIIREVRETAFSVVRNLQKARFRPYGYEVTFGVPDEKGRIIPPVTLKLSSGKKLQLNGKVDRVDLLLEENNRGYYRVIDYKSSAHEIHRVGLEYGLELQIPIYLVAMKQHFPKMEPAGGLYQSVKQPMVDAADEDVERLENKMDSELRMQGILLDEEQVLSAMGTVKTSKAKDVIALVSMEDMSLRMEEAVHTAEHLADMIYAGNISIRPVKIKNTDRSPCQYCDAYNACPVDSRIRGGQVEVLSETEDFQGDAE